MNRSLHLRDRIGTRIESIRNRNSSHHEPERSRSDGVTSSSLPAQSFRNLQRLQSADGFLVVNEGDLPSSPTTSVPIPDSEHSPEDDPRDDDDDEMDHLTLEQQGGAEDTSDVDLDDLVASLDDENPKAEGGGAKVSRSKLPSTSPEKKVETKPWLQGNQEVYEQQLMLLQEQLTTAMLRNQTLQGMWDGCGCINVLGLAIHLLSVIKTASSLPMQMRILS